MFEICQQIFILFFNDVEKILIILQHKKALIKTP
jgi:hypothetical protein